MKKKIIYSLLISTLLASGIPLFSLAATEDPWGPQWYTPYRAMVKITNDYAIISRLSWNQDSIDEYSFLNSWEWEFRPNNGANPDDFWSGPTDFFSTLPDAYYEYEAGQDPDDNDLVIASHSVHKVDADHEYYGLLYLDNHTQPNVTFTFESELGNDFGGYWDSLPLRYEVFKVNAILGNDYSWGW